MTADSLDRNDWKRVVLVAFLAGVVGLCSYRHVSPTARASRNSIENLADAGVTAIELAPGRHGSPIAASRKITDAASIARWIEAFSRPRKFRPNHPQVTRCMYLRFLTSGGGVGGRLCALEQGSPMFTLMGERGMVYGNYRLRDDTDLESLLVDGTDGSR